MLIFIVHCTNILKPSKDLRRLIFMCRQCLFYNQVSTCISTKSCMYMKYFVLIQGTIGRTLKEALSVACLSRRTYKKAINVMSLYKEWKTKKQTSGKVNAMLFGQLPGNRDESNIHRLLNLVELGAMSKKEFNEALKEAKVKFIKHTES